jgi:hypothetical protein
MWQYRSGDNSEHFFYDTLHDPACSVSITTNCDAVSPGVLYTRDGTYLRMTDSGTAKIVEFPDGQRHRFEYDSAAGWRLNFIYGASSVLATSGEPTTNWVKFDYPASTAYTGMVDWHITDSHGREHDVFFQPKLPQGSVFPIVDRIRVAAFRRPEDPANQPVTAEYDFTYDGYTFDASGRPVDGSPSVIAKPCAVENLTASVRL